MRRVRSLVPTSPAKFLSLANLLEDRLRRCQASADDRRLYARVAGSLLMAWLAVALSGPSAWAEIRQVQSTPIFELIDQNGRRLTEINLGAKPSVIHFGYTRCPVICPTTLYEVARRMKELGELSAEINFVFVTVDPERDTPSFLKDYIASFDERIVGLSGDPKQVAALAAWLGATYSKGESLNGDYSMDHTVNAFLVAQGWASVSTMYLGADSKEDLVLGALRKLVGRSAQGERIAPVSRASAR